MEEDYVDAQDSGMNEAVARGSDGNENIGDGPKDFGDMNYDDGYEDDDGGSGFRGGRGRGNFRGRGRGPPPGWMNGPPPMRFRGRGYGPGGPPMRGRGFFRGRPRYNNNFDNNWGPMGPPPPGMMGGPPPFPPHGMMGPGGPMGPPPNMMGQPPFGPPPNMPPPNMPAPELWVETKSEEGKSYYYHARTRETTWTRPQESPTCKVITQAEMEAMAAAGQMPPGGMAAPGMGMGGPALAGLPLQPPGALPPFMTQPPPWLKDGGKQENKPEASPNENDDSPPGERSPALQPPNGNMSYPPTGPGAFPAGPAPAPGQPPQGFVPPQGFPAAQAFPNNPPPGFNNAPGGFPGPGGPGPGGPGPGGPGPGGPGPGAAFPAWGGWGGWPPPLVAQPPPALASVPGAGAATAVPGTAEPVDQPPAIHSQPKKEETVIPAELAAAAAEWSAHRAPDGRPYYYNAGKAESVWEKPKPMKELEELQAKIAEEKGEKPDKVKMDNEGKMDALPVIDVEAHAEAVAAAEAERARQQQEREQADKEQAEREKAEQEKKEKEDKEKEKAKRKNKPISIMPITGTPWCLVWSGDGRVFFYNPTAHTSFWERPEQLVGRADVDRAMACPPAAVTQYFQRKEAATTPTATKPANGELKRSADSSSDDSDAEPAKKAKPEEAAKKPPSTTSSSLIDAGKEARIEAEARAARQRALVPLDQRVRVFRQMLQERDVSAFSTWEKELKKIVCDCRYLLLTSEERKQVYNKYVRERAEEERKEKKNKLQQKKNAFKQLMEEAKLHSKSSFNDFSTKHGRDDRFKGIDKPRDRVTYFNEYIADVRKREKEDKERKREQAKTDFIALLKEKAIDRHARWADAKKKVDSEARYKAVESSTLREDYFREYCKIVKEERKKDKDQKEKDRDRSSSKKEKKDKERDKDKDKEKEKEEKREKDGKKDKKKEKGSEPEAATGSEAEPEPEAEAEADSSDAESDAARERAARAQASIKEREREVQRALATSLRDRDKEREYHKRDEAVQHFNALLADLVRNPDLAWREAKKQLKKDHRYSGAELLTKEDKERLFSTHTSTLATRRRDKLRALLTEMGVAPTAHWRDVRARLRAEPAAPVYTSADKMEREFRDFQRDRQSAAKTALRQLLQETRSITHKTLSSVRDAPGGDQLQPVHDMLKHDARYLALDHIADERATIIQNYVEELAHKGPPPPPTATEPSRRAKQ